MTATYHDTVFTLAKEMKMTTLEDQQHIVNLLEDAMARVCEALCIEQRMSYTPSPHPRYQEIQDRLESLLDTERAILRRIQTVGC